MYNIKLQGNAVYVYVYVYGHMDTYVKKFESYTKTTRGGTEWALPAGTVKFNGDVVGKEGRSKSESESEVGSLVTYDVFCHLHPFATFIHSILPI